MGPLSRIVASVLVAATCVLATACATPSYGRVAPLVDIEADTYDCGHVEFELAKADGFCRSVLDRGFDGEDCAKGVAIALVPFVGAIHNAIQVADYEETLAALKSGAIRSAQLNELGRDKGCDLPASSSCPELCRRGTTTAVLTMENGFCGLRCTNLNRKERKLYADLIPDQR